MKEFLRRADEAALAAGTLIRDSWQKVRHIQYKSPIDLVTTVDRQSERCIVDILRGYFPEHSILAYEETTIGGSRDEYLWIIDPLDGTTNFAHAYPHVCVSIALERKGEVVLGLVHDPLRHETFRATQGGGHR